jgi:hypothetical protein
VAVGVDQPGQHGSAAEIERRLPGRRVDIAPAADKCDAAIAHDERVGHRVALVERVDARVGEDRHPANVLCVVSGVAVAEITTSPRRRRY